MAQPDFNALSEAEQRLVAERLLLIEQSGWKPFWCPDATCDGSPHWLVVEDPVHGETNLFVDATDDTGPNGEPVGDEFIDEDGVSWGRPMLDPKWAHNHARQDQRLPSWRKPWVLAIMSGRGTGKTRTGVEFVTLCARRGLDGAIIGRRGTELVNTHVNALVEHAHPEFKPEYLASKDILVWPNGATTFLFSAERPENIRSVNLSYFWMDEFAFMDEVETAWMNAKLATRIEKPGNPIHILMTSTPTSTPFVMKLEDEANDPTTNTELRRVSTYANKANLSPDFLAMLEKEYEGTRMGRQELYGEVLRDVEGALWNDGMYQYVHVKSAEQYADLLESMDDRVLAVDPAGSKGPRSDATGIIGMGAQHAENGVTRGYVLGDATIKGSPTEWAERVFKAARAMRVNRIIVERNFGADMVKQTLEDYAKSHPFEACNEDGLDFRIVEGRAVQGKETRAEPLVGRYEQGLITHVVGAFGYCDLSELEKEQIHWVPKSRGGRSPSPNRIDAEVWAWTELQQTRQYMTQSANSRSVLKRLKRR